MAEASDTYGIIYQNLVDAGCNKATIELCMDMAEKGEKEELLRLLARHKSSLLTTVRNGQKEIDCLDFLIY